MDTKDQISIILEEYKTLRTEILQRTSMLNQIYAVAGTIAAGIVGAMIQYGYIMAGLGMLSIVALLAALATVLIDHELRVVASHVRHIESEVNRLAGSRLLTWETDHGIGPIDEGERMADVMQSIRRAIKRARRSGPL